MEYALNADYAFVRAKRCDEFGNLVFQGSERNFNPIMAMAARRTIVEVEEIVPIGSIDPNQVHTVGHLRPAHRPDPAGRHLPRRTRRPARAV